LQVQSVFARSKALKRSVNVLSLSLVWLDRDVELDLRGVPVDSNTSDLLLPPGPRPPGRAATWLRAAVLVAALVGSPGQVAAREQVPNLSFCATDHIFLSFGNQAASGKVSIRLNHLSLKKLNSALISGL
jgi:hypothetical protein